MLRIYEVSLSVASMVAPLVRRLKYVDKSLADQLRRAAQGISLNLAEGSGNSAGNRRMRYESALGSAREVRAVLDVSEAFGYVRRVDPKLRDQLERIAATLVNLTR